MELMLVLEASRRVSARRLPPPWRFEPVPRPLARHGFWCAQAGREVEVQFQERGCPGFRYPVAVKACSVFEPATEISCARRCLDADFRRQWEPSLPVKSRR